jgi:hypothetical protein
MAKLLCVVHWSEDDQEHPEFPVAFQLTLVKAGLSEAQYQTADWIICCTAVTVQGDVDSPHRTLLKQRGQIL